MKQIYMDYAAATPVDTRVLAAMQPYYAELFHNPSAIYLAGKEAHAHLEMARAKVAGCLGARNAEIIFTSGATEANNLALKGLLAQYPDGQVAVSSIEHDAVLGVGDAPKLTLIPVDEAGIIKIDTLSQSINDHTVLVSVMLANNEIGTIQPIAEIAEIIKQIRQSRKKNGNKMPLYLHTDASQAGLYLDLHVNRLGVDLMTLNAGKMYGPKQSGALYVRAGVQLVAQLKGGGQEFGIRSGTESIAQAMGMATALELAQKGHKSESKRLGELQKLFFSLLETEIPEAVVNGSKSKRLANNVHITLPGRDNERLLMILDEQGICCATGSACSASSDTPSHVLRALGLSDEAAQSSLRFTMGRDTTEAAVRTVVATLKQVLTS